MWLDWMTVGFIWINLGLQLFSHRVQSKWRHGLQLENLDLQRRVAQLERFAVTVLREKEYASEEHQQPLN